MSAIDAQADLDESKVDVAMNGGGEETESRQKTVQEKEELKDVIRKKREPEIALAKKAAANVWITEMRFARRAEVRCSCSALSSHSVADSFLASLKGNCGSSKSVYESSQISLPRLASL